MFIKSCYKNLLIQMIQFTDISDTDTNDTVFIDKKCGNLKLVIDGGVLTKNINQKKMSGFYKPNYRS